MMKTYSIKTKVLMVLFGMVLPLMLIVIAYSFYFVHFYNDGLSDTNKNALEVYSTNLEEVFERLDERASDICINNNDFKMLSSTRDGLDAHLYSLSLTNQYKSLMNENHALYGCYIVSEVNQLFRSVFLDTTENYERKTALTEYLKEQLEAGTIFTREWKPVVIIDHVYLYQIKGMNGTYCIFVLDLEKMLNNGIIQEKEENKGEFVFFINNTILYSSEEFARSNAVFTGQEGYYFSGKDPQYMIIQNNLECCEVDVAYAMQYRGFFGSLTHEHRLILIGAFAVILVLVMTGYYQLKKILFQPMDLLVDTMNTIKEGNMDVKADIEFRDKELQGVNETFNSMLDRIHDLKIETYEKELNLRQTQLDYYQIQIRPHFYVNCLKCIYALLADGKREDASKSIILLSKHLRYMLKGASANVTLREEVQYVQNYIELQRMSMAYPPELEIELETGLEDFMIPAISVLSFVENSIKYGMKESQSLKVGVYANRMESDGERYLNIHISDNGVGYSDEVLRDLNNSEIRPNEGQSIGIFNVMQRFHLYYGEGNVLFAFSNMSGAHIDIFIKDVQGMKEAEHQ